ncbi:hypothetical protein EVAR_38453_1 [Eumeta japonica]|uniref:Uncharacterized protein n=1 Tax=Eumeta variegata TaxID=151549 RepID=A0A4C1WQD4_EUMVA|nr:hypothetical protein EVAR_38453_1 [Eumeta japonica]
MWDKDIPDSAITFKVKYDCFNSSISVESIAIEFGGELDKSKAYPAVSLELNSSSDAKRSQSNQSATATQRELSSGHVAKLGKGSACNHAPDSDVRAALILALLVASDADERTRGQLPIQRGSLKTATQSNMFMADGETFATPDSRPTLERLQN